ncbi:LysM peptidoglycan-binding domain-containing protein [Gandjariella thermophila]|uniref:Transglycosylase n=1 Tax=Gandjariella thermophila TaxID=1931992 RepID=A0A4D4JES7_9PSEU|nr:transglycosylase family protein [Gandjariella thermophila]GDY32373.1 transglycosylase [Gandjariella thermophila]
MGRHSKPSKTKTIFQRTSATAILAGATVGGLAIAGAGTANAFPGQAGLVRCESGGNPRAVNNTAAGVQAGRPAGLFQIVTKTWLANGGGQFAPTADKAAPWQQQIVADRIYARQGARPWQCKPGPGPSQFSNFAKPGGTAPVVATTPASAPAPHAPAPSGSGPRGEYTVVAGDTLWGIAQKFHVPGGWVQLQQLNHIPNADLILIGQQITVG